MRWYCASCAGHSINVERKKGEKEEDRRKEREQERERGEEKERERKEKEEKERLLHIVNLRRIK